MSMTRDPIIPTKRRAMTRARMERIHTRCDGICWFCGLAVPMFGPGVRYDHKLPLDLGGPDDDDQIFPLHTRPCDRIKTAADRARIDKARRQRKLIEERPDAELKGINPYRKLVSRGFDKTRRRRMDGRVELRQAKERADG